MPQDAVPLSSLPDWLTQQPEYMPLASPLTTWRTRAAPGEIYEGPLGQMRGGQAEARAYEPTWRDRIANFLLPDNPSYHAREIAERVLGSSGVGRAGPAAVDFVPAAGTVLGAQEAIQAGDIPEASGQIAATAVPGGALASKVLMPVARPVIRAATAGATGLAAGTAAALGLTPGEAEAQQRRVVDTLSPAEQAIYRSLGYDERIKFLGQREERLRAEAKEKAGFEQQQAATAAAENRAAEAKRAETEQAARLEQERIANANKARIEEEQRLSKLPFRERHPLAAALIQATTAAGAGAIPYGYGVRGNLAANANSKAWGDVANRAEQAILGGDINTARLTANELAQRNAGIASGAPTTAWNVAKDAAKGTGKALFIGNSALLPFEGGSVIPNAWDYYSRPEGDPVHDRAYRELTDPEHLSRNIGIGLAEGVTPALLGGKVANITHPRMASPIERSEALVKTYEQAFPPHVRDPSLTAPAAAAAPFYPNNSVPAPMSAPVQFHYAPTSAAAPPPALEGPLTAMQATQGVVPLRRRSTLTAEGEPAITEERLKKMLYGPEGRSTAKKGKQSLPEPSHNASPEVWDAYFRSLGQ